MHKPRVFGFNVCNVCTDVLFFVDKHRVVLGVGGVL